MAHPILHELGPDSRERTINEGEQERLRAFAAKPRQRRLREKVAAPQVREERVQREAKDAAVEIEPPSSCVLLGEHGCELLHHELIRMRLELLREAPVSRVREALKRRLGADEVGIQVEEPVQRDDSLAVDGEVLLRENVRLGERHLVLRVLLPPGRLPSVPVVGAALWAR